MPRPNILLVIEGTYPWYRGGVSEWVYQYIVHFSDVNFSILQVATDRYLNSSLTEALYPLPSRIREFRRIPPPNLSLDWEKESEAWMKRNLAEMEELFELCDLVHVANTGFAGWLGHRLSAAFKKPLVLTEHALYWKEIEMGAGALECGYKIPSHTHKKNEMVDMFKSLAGQIYRGADHVISVSKCNMDSQKKLGAEDVHYIPNGVSKNWFSNSRRWNFKELTLGWIGRCAEMKNPLRFFEVIDAFEFHKSEEQQSRYIMMCCDANEEELGNTVKKRAEDYPKLKLHWNRSAQNHLPEMDALCISSLNESQPLVLFEALSKQVLPVGWEVGDVTSSFGCIIPPESEVIKLANKVLRLWSNPLKWRRKVEKLHKKVRTDHRWENIFKKYERIFSSYLNNTN